MAKEYTVELLIANWDEYFPEYPLKIEDLAKPHALMTAIFRVFDRLDIDQDAVCAPPPEDERNENTIYYWDLIPVINTSRVLNHLFTILQLSPPINITRLMNPTVVTSHSILLLLYNIMLYRDDRLSIIAPYEQELFAQIDKISALTDKKSNLRVLLNEQSVAKGERVTKLKKLDREIEQLLEEIKHEKEDNEKLELEAVLKEVHQQQMIFDQKKTHYDALIAEVEKKRALRVYNAEDVRAQAEQAAKNVQDSQAHVDALQAKLKQKENSLKNLQAIRPNLDTANNLLHDLNDLSDSIRSYENGESECKEVEQEALNTSLSSLEAQFAELSADRDDARRKRQLTSARRQQERSVALSTLHEAEEKDKMCKEKSKKDAQTLHELQASTAQYEKQKVDGMEVLAHIKDTFVDEVNSLNYIFLNKLVETKEKVEAKLRKDV